MGVLVLCVLVFTVLLCCFIYIYIYIFIYLFLFVLSVLVEGLLPPSENSVSVSKKVSK